MGCGEYPGKTEEGVRPGGHVRCGVFLFSLEERGEKGERGRIVERVGVVGR